MLRRAALSSARWLVPCDLSVASSTGTRALAPVATQMAVRDYSSRRGTQGRVRGRRGTRGAAPPAADDPWEEVRDETTGQTYWWNVNTNETTALGEAKPQFTGNDYGGAPPPGVMKQGSNAVARPSGGSMLGGLGSMVAEGMAFGTGSALAHRAIGSMFGGGSYGGYGGASGGGAPTADAPAEAGGGWGDEMDDMDGDRGSFFDGFDFDE